MNEALPVRPNNDIADPWSVPFFDPTIVLLDKVLGREPTDEDRRLTAEAFAGYAMPHGGGFECVQCGLPLIPSLVDQMIGRYNKAGDRVSVGFRWGLAHGRGHCSSCNWPATAYHFVTFPDGQRRIEIILQVHPLLVEKRAKRSRAA